MKNSVMKSSWSGVGIIENLAGTQYASVAKIFFWAVPDIHRYPKILSGWYPVPKNFFWLVPGAHRYPISEILVGTGRSCRPLILIYIICVSDMTGSFFFMPLCFLSNVINFSDKKQYLQICTERRTFSFR